MSIRDSIPENVSPAGFKAWAEAVSDAVIAVVQQPGQELPARPNAVVVHWYSWDEPSGGAYIYDQWFQIPSPVLSAPDAFTAGQWSVADLTTGGALRVTISALPVAVPAISGIEYRIGGGAAVSSGISTTGTFDIAGLTNGVEVNVQLRAVNAEGNSDWSDTKAATPTLVTQWFTSFDEYSTDIGALPSDWSISEGNSGKWRVVDLGAGNLAMRLINTPSGGTPQNAIKWLTPGVAHGEIELYMRGETTYDGSSSLEGVIRLAEGTAFGGYRVDVNPSTNEIRLRRRTVSGSQSTVQTVEFVCATNELVRLVIRATPEGDDLRIRAWAWTDGEQPGSPQINWLDVAPLVVGGAGLHAVENRGDPTIIEFGVGINGSAAPRSAAP